jgi:ubiquinone/menaquinone biosynthesis C-methylase UbiE/uncharacterized protein YbaR (Trm112 family)
MQYELLSYLKCPITKTELRFELISEFEKPYADTTITEINEGLLFSETGFVFPIINGIPRMLLESIYDYADFLKKHLPGYEKLKDSLEANNKDVLSYCVTKNKKTKASFEFEWSFLNADKKDRVWHEDTSGLSSVFSKEVGEPIEYFTGKKIIDVGCGSGFMTSAIAGVSRLAIGVELSRSVENAFINNKTHNAWYIQGDLQFLPFQELTFDVLYSSGVIHHTNDTEQSLSLIETVLKNNGKICLWLYHPQKSKIHNFILFLRKFTKRMPLKLCFVFLTVFVFPFTYLIKRIKNKKAPNYREEIIDLLDGFTPEFRFEIPHDLAITWLSRRKYNNIKITSENQFGFSIAGDKQTGS